MNRAIPFLTNPEYMGIVGAFLGINTGVYNILKSEYFAGDIFATSYSGFIGGILGAGIGLVAPPIIPVYLVSIPCYFGMKYLIKKELI